LSGFYLLITAVAFILTGYYFLGSIRSADVFRFTCCSSSVFEKLVFPASRIFFLPIFSMLPLAAWGASSLWAVFYSVSGEIWPG
jgi:hypothetical protein